MPTFAGMTGAESKLIAEAAAERILSLPMFPTISEPQQKTVAEAVMRGSMRHPLRSAAAVTA